MAAKKVFAIGAHPDDIEFGMAGTMLRLAQAGCELHYMTFCNGSCGSNVMDQAETIRVRGEEERRGAARLGAVVHPMRLTFVEVFKNAGYTGGGEEYHPFGQLTVEN